MEMKLKSYEFKLANVGVCVLVWHNIRYSDHNREVFKCTMCDTVCLYIAILSTMQTVFTGLQFGLLRGKTITMLS